LAEDGPAVLIDARWAHHSGATTFTRSLLQGLGQIDPPGRWLLWGPTSFIEQFVWSGAVHVPTPVDPVSWFGQKSAFRVPRADLVVHPHQTRPLHFLPAASCVLDLIQLQDPSPPIRLAKSLRLRASVRAAKVLFTIASSVRDELIADFHVDPSSVAVLRLPVDGDSSARVEVRRRTSSPQQYLLAVGRFDRHKNLLRLIEAFTHTRFAARGGALHLAGGTVEQLARLGIAVLPPGVRVLSRLDQAGLEDAMVGATALVQASLVEGYGLPVAEALLAMVPVASSPVPAVSEFGPPGVPTFDPRSVASIGEVIDETVDLAEEGRYWQRVDRTAWAASRPTPRTLAEQVLAALSTAGPMR